MTQPEPSALNIVLDSSVPQDVLYGSMARARVELASLRARAAVFDDAVKLARSCLEFSRHGSGACLGCTTGSVNPKCHEETEPCEACCPIASILAAAKKLHPAAPVREAASEL